MSQAPSPATGTPYGLARVCRVGGVARASVSWHRHGAAEPGGRRGPVGPGADDDLGVPIRRLVAAAPFPGAGDRTGWARRRDQGSRTSPRRVWRLRRAHGWLAPPRQGQPHGPNAHAGTLLTERVETMGGTAMTTTCTRQDGQVAIFLAVAHGAAECGGLQAALPGPRCAALEPRHQGVRTQCGALGQNVAQGLQLRPDPGSQ
jgi:putative transposase